MIGSHPCAHCGRLTTTAYTLCAYCWARLQGSEMGRHANPYASLVAPLPVKLLCWGKRHDEYRLTLQPGDEVVATEVQPEVDLIFLLHVPTGVKLWALLRHWKKATGQAREARH